MPRGAYSIAKLRSGKIGSSSISRDGISMARKSSKPMDLSVAAGCCLAPTGFPIASQSILSNNPEQTCLGAASNRIHQTPKPAAYPVEEFRILGRFAMGGPFLTELGETAKACGCVAMVLRQGHEAALSRLGASAIRLLRIDSTSFVVINRACRLVHRCTVPVAGFRDFVSYF